MIPPKEKETRKFLAKAGKFSGLGISLLAIILGFTFLGNWMDHHFGNLTPWLTAIFSLMGIGIGLYSVFIQLKS